MSASASAAAASAVVGKGAYGLVLKPALPNFYNDAWHEYPDNVTKLFFKKKQYNEIVKLAPNISTILGANNGHRISTYRHKYKTKNLPANIQPLTKLNAEEELFPVRMPDLGVSMDRVYLPENLGSLKKVPVSVLLTQILKLIQQVKSIKDHGYIHGDIKPANVMIRPTDGTMTLIDFDMLMPRDRFQLSYPFGYYCHPPETLKFFENKYRARGVDMGKANLSYVTNFQGAFAPAVVKLHPPSVLPIPEFTSMVRNVAEANYIQIQRRRKTIDDLLQTFDSFGLAMTLLTVLETLYPECVVPAELLTEAYKEFFKGQLVSGELTTGENPDAVTTALLSLTANVLIPMREFSILRRMTIDEAFAQVTAIVTAYQTSVASGEGAIGGGSVSAAVRGGGASNTRRARRTRRQQRKSPR